MEAYKIITILFIYLVKFGDISCDIIDDNVTPCAIDDQECLLDIFRTVKRLAGNGITELDLPPFDPLEIRDVAVELPEGGQFNITKALLAGHSKCVYVSSIIDIRSGNGTIPFECTVTVKGNYSAVIPKPFLFGIKSTSPLTGSGPFLIKSDNTRYISHFHFNVVKDTTGVIRLTFGHGNVDYLLHHKAHQLSFDLSNVMSGGKDVTVEVNKLINKNWKMLSPFIMNAVLQGRMGNILSPEMVIFFTHPATTFISDDLEPYVTEIVAPPGELAKKCRIDDTDCHLELVKSIAKKVSNGVPELKIPKQDSLLLTDLTVNLPGLMDLTLVEGRISGADRCEVKNGSFNMSSKKFTIDQHCDLELKGTYKAVLHKNATMSTFGGQSVNAHGNVEVKLVKLPLNADNGFKLTKKANGDTHFNFQTMQTNYDYNLPGHKIEFKMDGVYLGTLDISEIAMNILNDNWDYFAPEFGPSLVNELNKILTKPLLEYLSSSPTNVYFVEPLDKFVDITEN